MCLCVLVCVLLFQLPATSYVSFSCSSPCWCCCSYIFTSCSCTFFSYLLSFFLLLLPSPTHSSPHALPPSLATTFLTHSSSCSLPNVVSRLSRVPAHSSVFLSSFLVPLNLSLLLYFSLSLLPSFSPALTSSPLPSFLNFPSSPRLPSFPHLALF